jgi:hypothetical protein
MMRGKSMLGMPREALAWIAIASAPVLFAWAVLWVYVFPPPVLAVGMRAHAVCFFATLGLSLGPFAALAFVRRASDPVHPGATGAVVGAAAGGWGSVLIDLHCPASAADHIALGHVLPALVLAIAGALVGARVLGVRAR